MLVWALVGVGIVTALVLGAILVALVGHLRRLGTSARRLSDDLSPLLEDIQRDSERARARAQRLSESLPDAGR